MTTATFFRFAGSVDPEAVAVLWFAIPSCIRSFGFILLRAGDESVSKKPKGEARTHARTPHTSSRSASHTAFRRHRGAGKTTVSVEREREERATTHKELACLPACHVQVPNYGLTRQYAEGPGFSLNERNESALGGVGPGIRWLGRRQGDVEAECPGDI